MSHVLVYGLSAHPIHRAHVALVTGAVRALERRGYDIVKTILVPVYRRNPVGSRKESLPATFEHRFAMCGLAAREVAQQLGGIGGPIKVSRIAEQLAVGREAPNYTAETLAVLRTQEPADRGLLFLMSSDLVSGSEPELGKWHRLDLILQLATLALCHRPGYERNETFLSTLEERGGQIIFLESVRTMEISATEIRERLRAGARPEELAREGLIPAVVARYIEKHEGYVAALTEETTS